VFATYDREYLIRDDPELETTPELVSELQRRLVALGRYSGRPTGAYDGATRQAVADYAGEVNLEGKVRHDDLIHESIVREIRDVTPEIS
ncbi:MAG: putative peptidoglycan binding domain-containing protein, partial [Actinomycetota bacterium]